MYYYPIPDLAIIPLSNGKVLLKSDNLAIRIDGNSTALFINQVLPLLDGLNDLNSTSKLSGINIDELRKTLDQFVNYGVLRKSKTPKNENAVSQTSPHFNNFLDSLGLNLKEVNNFLKEKNVGIIGLDGLGFYVLEQLIQYGICNFHIADTSLIEDSDLYIFPFLNNNDIGKERQEIIKKELNKKYTHLDISLIDNLSKEELRTFVKDCDIILGCFDKDFVASNYWINEISLELKIPSIYAEIKGQKCLIGPLVIPEITPCYMCYKMRGIACEDNFEEAMAYEEYSNAIKKSNFSKRSFFPSNINIVASILNIEVIKLLLALDLPSLKNKLLEVDAFKLTSKTHNILVKPDCPICQKKKQFRKQYNLNDLLQLNSFEGVIKEHEKTLVSNKTGIVKFYNLFKKDISEPNIPFIYRADLANHNFIPNLEVGDTTCSGKGLTIEKAKISALGEAVERYSGAVYNSDEVVYEVIENLSGEKLHPKRLVLFDSHQYPNLEYSQYQENNKIGWTKAFSLLHEKSIWVPAISIFMDYKIRTHDEYLYPVTSNGLGAGATLLQAILSAALEVIERDIFIITWHQKLPCIRYNPLTIPMSDIVKYCRMYLSRGVELSLFRLPTDFPCYVFLAIAQQVLGDGPAIVVGLGADFNPQKAAASALIEAGQVRPALRKRTRLEETKTRLAELINDPNKVKELEDHDLLYSSPTQTHHFDFLLNQPKINFDLKEIKISKKEQIKLLLEHVKKINSDLIYYNLTPIDMEKLNIHTARVIIPDLQPIHFGANKIRLNGKRLYELPFNMGLKKSINDRTLINLQPHPLA